MDKNLTNVLEAALSLVEKSSQYVLEAHRVTNKMCVCMIRDKNNTLRRKNCKKIDSKTVYKSVSYQAATWLLSCGGDGITSR